MSKIICRCEDVSEEDIEKLIDEGITDIDEMKKLLRVTMGPCQGRTCRRLILGILRRKTGLDVNKIKPGRTRAPIKGVLIDTIGNEEK